MLGTIKQIGITNKGIQFEIANDFQYSFIPSWWLIEQFLFYEIPFVIGDVKIMLINNMNGSDQTDHYVGK